MPFKKQFNTLLFLLFAFTSFGQDYEKANQLMEAEKYAEAAAEYEKVIPWLKEELGKNDTTGLPIYYFLMGSAYYQSGDLDNAIRVHNLNHELCLKEIKGSSEMHINSMLDLCEIATYNGDSEGLEYFRGEIVKSRLKAVKTEESQLQLGYAYNDYGIALYNLGKDNEAIINYKKSIEILNEILGKTSLETANVWINLSNSQIFAKQYNEAKKSYITGFRIYYNHDKNTYASSIRSMRTLAKELTEYNLFEEAKHALYIDIQSKIENISKTDTSLIESYIDLGFSYYYLDDNLNGIKSFDSAVTVIDHSYKPNTYDWAFWHSYIGGNYDVLGDTEKAIFHTQKAFSYFTPNDKEYVYAYMINNNALLAFYLKLSKYKEALTHSEIKVANYEKDLTKKENFPYYLTAVLEKAEIQQNLLQHTEAIATLNNALSITKKEAGKNSVAYVNLVDLLAKNFTSIAQFEKARTYNEERNAILLEMFGENSLDYCVGLNDLGLIYVSEGEYLKALALFQKAYPVISKLDYLNNCNVLNNIARCYMEMADFKKAKQYYDQSIALHLQNDTINEHYCAALINIAVLHVSQKEFLKGEEYFDKAKEVILTIDGKENYYYVSIVNSLANIYLNTQRYDKCLDAYTESMELTPKILGPDNPLTMDLIGNFGHALCIFQKFDLGIEILSKVHTKLIKSLGEHNPKSMLNASNLGFAYHSAEKDVKAYEMVKKQFATISYNINYSLKYLSEGESIAYLKQMAIYYSLCYSYLIESADLHPDLIETGLNSLLQTKGKLLHSNTALKNQILSSKDPKLVETYRLWLDKVKVISKLQSGASIDLKLLDQTQKEAEQMEKFLIESSKEFAKALDQSYDWKDVQKNLSDNETVVEFVKFNHQQKFTSDTVKYGAFIFNKTSSTPKFIEICNEADIVAVIGKYGGNNLSYIKGIYGKKGEKSQLYNLLWEPISKHIPANAKVIIAPDGILHKISFAGISNGDTFLNQLYEIKNVSTAISLLNKEQALTSINPIIIGGINYDYQVDKDADHIWTFLEGTKIESKQISDNLSAAGIKPTYLSGSEATEINLKKLLPTKNVAHIATHGFFYPNPLQAEEIMEQEVITDEEVAFRGGTRGLGYSFYVSNTDPMMRSGIALTGANQVWNKTDINLESDGVLTAQDIAIMDLRNLELVVLSACETGLGDIEGSEGVYGLQRSLKMAGVNKIVMSLWQVPDTETKEFMILFYTNLIETKNVELSFNKAQLEMSKKYDAFYWAAFILI